MKLAKVDANGVVVDTVVGTELAGWVSCPDHVGIGMRLDAPAPAPDYTAEKAAVLAEARAVRERIFAILAGMQAESLALGDTTTARAIADAQAALRGITTLPAVVAAVTAAETRAAIMAAYADIAVAVPANVRSAFRVLEQ